MRRIVEYLVSAVGALVICGALARLTCSHSVGRAEDSGVVYREVRANSGPVLQSRLVTLQANGVLVLRGPVNEAAADLGRQLRGMDFLRPFCTAVAYARGDGSTWITLDLHSIDSRTGEAWEIAVMPDGTVRWCGLEPTVVERQFFQLLGRELLCGDRI